MEFDDGRKCDAIEKANQRWNNIYNNYERDKIKYDDWLDLFDRAICKKNEKKYYIGKLKTIAVF